MIERAATHERLPLTSPMYGLQGRIELYNPALKGTAQDSLNIRNKSLTVSREALGQQEHEPEFQKLLSHASTEERGVYWANKNGGYEDHMNSWKQSVVQGINAKKTYFSKPEHVEFFKTLGVDSTGFNDAKAQELYNKYFSGSKTASHIDIFTASVLDQIKGPLGTFKAEKLAEHAEGIRFIASIFGKDAADIVMQKLQSTVELANNEGAFVEHVKTAVNTIAPASHEEHLVVYLQKAQDTYRLETTPTPLPTPTIIPPPPSPAPLPTELPTEPPGPEVDKKLEKLTERFDQVKAKPELSHKYVIGKVPKQPVSENLPSYELKETFFEPQVDEMGQVYGSPNRKTASYVYDLGDGQPAGQENERYMEAEKLTNWDSGLFAVAAASAKTPEEQAKYYLYLSKSILEIHKNPELLKEWLQKQVKLSNELFIQFDNFKDQEGKIPRTDKKEKLLRLSNGGRDIDIESTAHLWRLREVELRMALRTDSLEEHHIRWLEFLSHSVKVPELIRKARE